MRRLAAGIALSVLALSAAATVPAAAAQRPLAVTAFQTEDSPTELIDASRAAITTLGVDGVVVRESGASVGSPTAAALRQLHRANADGLRAELLVSNYSNKIYDFSEPLAHRLLGSRRHIAAVTASLVRDVDRQGWDGISVDLESMLPRDAAGLNRFVQALRNALPARASLSICVMSSTHPSGYLANGYDLATITEHVDRVMVMTYDEHGPWEDTPGPVNALHWQREGMRAAEHFVPKSKLDMGVAGYGYAWRPHSNDELTVSQARAMAGKRARFDATRGEWTATLADGSVLWWADARSYRLRVKLARRLGVHGLAVWVLGSADPLS